MAAAGMPDGEFSLGGLQVRVRDGMARIVEEDGSPGNIAGSTLTMAEAFAAMTSIVADIELVTAMTSTNAAHKFGLDGVGRIEAGGRADLCVVNDRGMLQRVMQSGEWRPEPTPT
jgi:N-acetylglucosamine-6-phosphate deacetylase